jgi:hypothetical protein
MMTGDLISARRDPFEPMTTGQLLSLFVGALLGFGASTIRDMLDRRRRRRSVATAILLELDSFEDMFRAVATADDSLAIVTSPWSETIARPTDWFTLFRPATVHELMRLKYRLDSDREEQVERRRDQAEGKRVPERQLTNMAWARKCEAIFIVGAIVAARRELRREGGTPPRELAPVRWDEPNVPPLPPSDPVRRLPK